MKSRTITINQAAYTCDLFWAFAGGKGRKLEGCLIEFAVSGGEFIIYGRATEHDRAFIKYEISRNNSALNSIESSDIIRFFSKEWEKFVVEFTYACHLPDGAPCVEVLSSEVEKQLVGSGCGCDSPVKCTEQTKEERVISLIERFKEEAVGSLNPESWGQLEQICGELLMRKLTK